MDLAKKLCFLYHLRYPQEDTFKTCICENEVQMVLS